MTRLARRAPLLVALCLLTSAATASAECAWVLWEGRPKKPVLPLADVDLFSFKRVSAFTTFEACSASAKIQAEGTARVWTGTSEGKSKWMATGSGGVWEVDMVFTASSGREYPLAGVSQSYRCFPETVDLRKGWWPW